MATDIQNAHIFDKIVPLMGPDLTKKKKNPEESSHKNICTRKSLAILFVVAKIKKVLNKVL